MSRQRFSHATLMGTLLILSAATAFLPAQEPAPQAPQVAAASAEGQLAIARFHVPKGFKTELFAAEPLMANPVAIGIDERGRVYVCESFRQNNGITDNRNHDEKWLD